MDWVERPPWFRGGENDGIKPKGLEPFGGSDGYGMKQKKREGQKGVRREGSHEGGKWEESRTGSMSAQTRSLEDWGGD